MYQVRKKDSIGKESIVYLCLNQLVIFFVKSEIGVFHLPNGYYGAVTPQIRQAGNRLSGLTETACASLLA